MIYSSLVARDCVQCNNETPTCPVCPSDQQCVIINQTCNECSSAQCVSNNPNAGVGGISKGAVAGAVVGAVIFLVLGLSVFIYYRRRYRTTIENIEEVKPDEPARAEDVLNRPDPNEKAQQTYPDSGPSTVRVYAGDSNTTINLDPASQIHQNSSVHASHGHATNRGSTQSNPFTDTHSIQTTSTGSQLTNVIPIALVAPGSVASTVTTANATAGSNGSSPIRPERTPDLDLLDSNKPSYALSQRSGSSTRHSYMTTGSFASDILNETPVIVTPTRGTVKQVVGLVRAEVIRTPGSSAAGTPTSSDLTRSSSINRPPVRSPLAASSFVPGDAVREDEEKEASPRNNPFSDEHNAIPDSGALPLTAQTGANAHSQDDDWTPEGPRFPWSAGPDNSRPTSLSTQAGSIISESVDIAHVTRVQVGLQYLSPSSAGGQTTPQSAQSAPRTMYRMTNARLVAPPSADSDTQASAFEQLQARAMREINMDRPMSTASAASAASRPDSILESFPFVPPSPISDRPIRTPPRSPLAQQAFATSSASADQSRDAREDPLPPPPNRKQLGMSTASQSSTMSNGLSSFPFQIDSGNGLESDSGSPPSAFLVGRQRASLDTLALTSDLSSYPLGFDKTMMDSYPGARRDTSSP